MSPPWHETSGNTALQLGGGSTPGGVPSRSGESRSGDLDMDLAERVAELVVLACDLVAKLQECLVQAQRTLGYGHPGACLLVLCVMSVGGPAAWFGSPTAPLPPVDGHRASGTNMSLPTGNWFCSTGIPDGGVYLDCRPPPCPVCGMPMLVTQRRPLGPPFWICSRGRFPMRRCPGHMALITDVVVRTRGPWNR